MVLAWSYVTSTCLCCEDGGVLKPRRSLEKVRLFLDLFVLLNEFLLGQILHLLLEVLVNQAALPALIPIFLRLHSTFAAASSLVLLLKFDLIFVYSQDFLQALIQLLAHLRL